MNDLIREPSTSEDASRAPATTPTTPQKPKRTASTARGSASSSVEAIRKRLIGQIDQIDEHITQLSDFCKAARSSPESCDPTAAKKAANGIQTVTNRAQDQLTKLSEARAQEQRKKLLDLGSILGDALNVDSALNAAANGADKDAVVRALLAERS